MALNPNAKPFGFEIKPPVEQVNGDWDESLEEESVTSPQKVTQVQGIEEEESATSSQQDVNQIEQKLRQIEVEDAKNQEPSTPEERESSMPVKREADAVIREQEEELDDELVTELYGKEHVNLVFIGHVDAGKSTLGGNLLYITGMVDQRTLEKYERESREAGRPSWYLSWALDSTREERDKGKTVEVGRAYFETEKRRYTLLDAPGHKSYVPSMISGAAQADLGVLVISARKGEYETGFERGGQTREHAVLAKTQGITRLLVVVNKMDDPTVNWSKDRFDECTSKLTVFLKNTGYNPKKDLYFMPVSAFTGKGIKDPIAMDCPWYTGPTLLEYLDTMQGFDRKINAPLMLPIGSKYRDMGTVVEGKIESGHIRKTQNVLLMPNNIQVEVTNLYGEAEDEVQAVTSGEQARLRLKGVEEEDIPIGAVISSIKHPVHVVKAFEAQVAIIELKSLLTVGYSCVIHVHTAVEEITFEQLLHKLNKEGKRSKKPPPFAKRGERIIARLALIAPVCLERFEDFGMMGRFTLRDQGNRYSNIYAILIKPLATTIAIGKVTKLILE